MDKNYHFVVILARVPARIERKGQALTARARLEECLPFNKGARKTKGFFSIKTEDNNS